MIAKCAFIFREWRRQVARVPPHVVVMGFDEAGRVSYEHIYWDQATLLVQVGILDPALLPVAGTEQAKRLLDPTQPANEMIGCGWIQNSDLLHVFAVHRFNAGTHKRVIAATEP